MYAPGLGFLMFAVGVNLQLQAFATVFRRPKVQKLSVHELVSITEWPFCCPKAWTALTFASHAMQLLLLGVIGQWLVKPALGMLLASSLVPILQLPSQVATGLILVSLYPTAFSNHPHGQSYPYQHTTSCQITIWNTKRRSHRSSIYAGLLCIWSTVVQLCNLLGAS